MASAVWVFLGLAAAALAGCTPAQYAKQADKTAYSAMASGQRAAVGSPAAFNVSYEPYEPAPGSGTIAIDQKQIPVNGEAPAVLSIDECLAIAMRNSRTLQTRKEQLYSLALALANRRRGWDVPLFSGPLTANVSGQRTGDDAPAYSADGQARPTLTQQFVSGGALTLGTTLDLASDLLGWKSTTVGSLLEANFTQPLLRGAWHGFAYEPQYRLERDFLFAVYDFQRFTQTFAVGIVTQYYLVLQQRDQLENERQNIARLEDTYKLTKVLADGGQVSQIQADQAEQNLMDAQVRFQQIVQGYQNQLDRFKLLMGLTIRAAVEPQYPQALEALRQAGPKDMPLEEVQAVAVALATRPDVLRQRAAVRDADRDVEIAADGFLPQLDASLGISAESLGPRDFTEVRFDRNTRLARASFQYNLDQTGNRDAYRNSLLSLERSKRDWTDLADRVSLDVRESYRELMQSAASYGIQVRNVEVAQRRRELAVVEQKQGLASARDVLEAEQALLTAQNGKTRALLSYTTTRMSFLATLGLIDVDEKGLIHERTEPFTFDLIGRRYPYVGGP